MIRKKIEYKLEFLNKVYSPGDQVTINRGYPLNEDKSHWYKDIITDRFGGMTFTIMEVYELQNLHSNLRMYYKLSPVVQSTPTWNEFWVADPKLFRESYGIKKD